MANLQDIREWGKTNGFDVSDSGPLPRGLRAAYSNRSDDDVITEIVPDEDEGSKVIEHSPKVVERPPTVHKPSLVSRARAAVGKRADEAPRVSGPSKPRKSLDRIIERAWDMLGRVIQPVNLPVARVMAVQAPVAGLLLEDIVKGTIVDKVLQPVARVEEKGELAFALIGPPLLVGLLTSQRGQQLAPVLVPALKESLRVWLEVAGPKIEIARKRDEEFAAKYGAQIDTLIDSFFAPPEGYVPNHDSATE